MDDTLNGIPSDDTPGSQTHVNGEIDLESPQSDQRTPDVLIPSRVNSGQVRESWTKESQRKTHVEGTSIGNPDTFGIVGNIIRNIFKWRLRRSTPQVTPETLTPSNFIDPTRSQPDTQGSNLKSSGSIAMQTFQRSDDEGNLNQFGNPSYVKSTSESDRFDEAIFNGNSTINHVPITIEEDDRSEDLISLDDDNAFEDLDSQTHLEPTSYQTKFEKYCKQPARAIWRKTYLPDSNLIYGWLMVVTLAFLYNLWLIPLRASFITGVQIPYQSMFFVFDAVSDAIYIIDIIVKFRTRYIDKGVYVKDRKSLNRHHSRNWTVVLDFLSIFPTDLFFLQSINPYYRINRIMRFYRVFTLYRMVELRTRIPNTWRVLQLSHFVVVLVHYNACIYYAAAVANEYYGNSVDGWAFPDPNLFPDYNQLTRQYTFSFYWILHAMCSIGSRPLPDTTWQFTYTIFLNISGVAITAFIIGYVTMLLIGYQSSKIEFEKSMETARAFMKRRHLPKELRHRVDRFYEHMWTNSEFSQLDEKSLLRHLPLSVKQEIAIHGNFSAIKQIPEFAACDSSILRELVMRMKRRMYLPGQFVYKNGDAGSEMYIVGEGYLQSIKSSDGNVGLLKDGDVFGEMNILNLRKNHRRTCDVISCGYTELYVLGSNDVNEALSKYPRVMNLILQQARRHRGVLQNTSHSEYGSQMTKSHTSGVDSGKGSSYRSHIWEENTNMSPDSALPSSPGVQVTSRDRVRVPSAIGMVIRPDLAEMLTKVYQDNLKALEKSLTDVWTKEISNLQHRIAVTEAERDEKANEVIKLRQREETEDKSNSKQQIKQSNTDLQKSIKVNDNMLKTNTKEKDSNNTLNTTIKATSQEKGPRKRTILPTSSTSSNETPSTFASDVSLQRRASQVPKHHPIQETPLDVYKSLASLKSVT